MTHHGPPGRPLPGSRADALTRIVSVIGIALGVVFAVAGLVVAGIIVVAVANMNFHGSNK